MTEAAQLQDLQAFTRKWRERWPEWGIAEVFLPRNQRHVAVAWFALLQELADAAWAGEDPTPGLAKLAWWQEELRGWAKGARRHPLGAALLVGSLPWDSLANAMSVLRRREIVGADMQASLDALRPLSMAIAQVEAALFEGSRAGADSVSAALLAPFSGGEGARELLSRMDTDGTRPRRLLAEIERARLQRVIAGKAGPNSRWRTLWRAWGAARY